jgi:hypothetical protein
MTDKPKGGEVVTSNEFCYVMTRVRPFLKKENGKSSALTIINDHTFDINYRDETISCVLDKVFSEESTQKQVFYQFQAAVDSFITGTNITLLAYGHTGAGTF